MEKVWGAAEQKSYYNLLTNDSGDLNSLDPYI